MASSQVSNREVLLAQGAFVSSANPQHKLGTRGYTEDGRAFRYAKAGASDLVAGNCIQSSAIVALHLANTPPAVAIGAKSFSYTPGATAAAADYYADGYLGVDTTPGNGYTYGLGSHAAITASTAFTLNLDDPIQVALTSSSRVGLLANPYRDVVQMPVTTATGVLVGVAPYIIAATQYGWLQTWGPCSTLIAGTPALGAIVMTPGAAAGAAEIIVAAGTLIVAQIVGNMMQIGVSGKNNWVYLKIAP
jgi:hypothetical protein